MTGLFLEQKRDFFWDLKKGKHLHTKMKSTGFVIFLALLASGFGNKEKHENREHPSQDEKECAEVRIQFEQEKVGSGAIVPDSPIHGTCPPVSLSQCTGSSCS